MGRGWDGGDPSQTRPIAIPTFNLQSRDGNGASLGQVRVTPIPTLPRLFKIILIPVPFKKLNGAGRGRAGRGRYATFPYPPRLAFYLILILIFFKNYF